MRPIDADELIELLAGMQAVCHTRAELVGISKVWQQVKNMPTIDAIPIEFIEKRIAELKKLNEYEFIANGGYTSPSDYEQWELERLIRDWKEENNGQG